MARTGHDNYFGTADAFVAAGLVPALKYFPGQPGANRTQASYRKDWRLTNNAPSQHLAATIKRKGKSQFCVELPVDEQEEARRNSLWRQHRDEESARRKAAAEERRALRKGAAPPEALMTAMEFRQLCVDHVEHLLPLLWRLIERPKDGWRLNILKGSGRYDEVAEAIASIDNAFRTAGVLRDPQFVEASRERIKVAAARKDTGLQNMLRTASHLRLVRGAPDGQ